MAKFKYDSYEAGFHDCQIQLSGKSDLITGTDFTPPNEDAGELDQEQYMRGQIAALVKHCKGGILYCPECRKEAKQQRVQGYKPA